MLRLVDGLATAREHITYFGVSVADGRKAARGSKKGCSFCHLDFAEQFLFESLFLEFFGPFLLDRLVRRRHGVLFAVFWRL